MTRLSVHVGQCQGGAGVDTASAFVAVCEIATEFRTEISMPKMAIENAKNLYLLLSILNKICVMHKNLMIPWKNKIENNMP